MVDLMTVIPIFVMFGDDCPALAASNTSLEILKFILCALGTTRILRALRLRRRFVMIEDEVQQFLANMCLNIVVMILFSKCTYLNPIKYVPIAYSFQQILH